MRNGRSADLITAEAPREGAEVSPSDDVFDEVKRACEAAGQQRNVVDIAA